MIFKKLFCKRILVPNKAIFLNLICKEKLIEKYKRKSNYVTVMNYFKFEVHFTCCILLILLLIIIIIIIRYICDMLLRTCLLLLIM